MALPLFADPSHVDVRLFQALRELEGCAADEDECRGAASTKRTRSPEESSPTSPKRHVEKRAAEKIRAVAREEASRNWNICRSRPRHRAVCFDRRRLEKLRRLSCPHPQPCLIDRPHQILDFRWLVPRTGGRSRRPSSGPGSAAHPTRPSTRCLLPS
jgi:hypothetical protein